MTNVQIVDRGGNKESQVFVFRCLGSERHEFIYCRAHDTHYLADKDDTKLFFKVQDEFHKLSEDELLLLMAEAELENQKYLRKSSVCV